MCVWSRDFEKHVAPKSVGLSTHYYYFHTITYYVYYYIASFCSTILIIKTVSMQLEQTNHPNLHSERIPPNAVSIVGQINNPSLSTTDTLVNLSSSLPRNTSNHHQRKNDTPHSSASSMCTTTRNSSQNRRPLSAFVVGANGIAVGTTGITCCESVSTVGLIKDESVAECENIYAKAVPQQKKLEHRSSLRSLLSLASSSTTSLTTTTVASKLDNTIANSDHTSLYIWIEYFE
jgi:hypothetical protein